MLGNRPGMRKNQYVPDYVIFDLETTGISPSADAVIEVSGIRVRGGRAVEEFSSFVNPHCHIPCGATRINGITDDMVADAPSFEAVLRSFLEFVGEDPLVGHNIHSFDMKFLYRDSRLCFGAIPDNDYIDTLYLARRTLPQLGHHRLVDLAAHYQLSTEGAHRALADCRMNQAVFERLAKELPPGGSARGLNGASGSWKICPQCGERMWKRKGRYGEFWGCGGYPSCRHTERL